MPSLIFLKICPKMLRKVWIIYSLHFPQFLVIFSPKTKYLHITPVSPWGSQEVFQVIRTTIFIRLSTCCTVFKFFPMDRILPIKPFLCLFIWIYWPVRVPNNLIWVQATSHIITCVFKKMLKKLGIIASFFAILNHFWPGNGMGPNTFHNLGGGETFP